MFLVNTTSLALAAPRKRAVFARASSYFAVDSSFVDRYLNEGFSGGEKKRNEIMQMAILEPELAILDETDSGLDIDALRVVARGIREVRVDRPSMGVVLITHYQRLLDEVTPDHIHILVDGRIVATGGMELAEQLERDGYDAFRPTGGDHPVGASAGGSTVSGSTVSGS